MVNNSTYSDNNSKGVQFIKIFATFILFAVLFPLQHLAAQQITERDKFIADLQVSEPSAASKLEALMFEIQPTLYLNEGIFTPKGEGQMVVININAKDINKLQVENDHFNLVNLLNLKISDEQEFESFQLQPNFLDNLPNLSYVFLSLDFETNFQSIESKLLGFTDSRIIFLYESARPF